MAMTMDGNTWGVVSDPVNGHDEVFIAIRWGDQPLGMQENLDTGAHTVPHRRS